jgi:hypothetical protein
MVMAPSPVTSDAGNSAAWNRRQFIPATCDSTLVGWIEWSFIGSRK